VSGVPGTSTSARAGRGGRRREHHGGRHRHQFVEELALVGGIGGAVFVDDAGSFGDLVGDEPERDGRPPLHDSRWDVGKLCLEQFSGHGGASGQRRGLRQLRVPTHHLVDDP
jgi:hypothetical protein